MERGEVVGPKRTQRVHRSMAEKRRIGELVLRPGVYALTPFFKPKYLLPCLALMVGNLRFNALAVAAGVLDPVDVVLVEHREFRGSVRDGIIGGMQRLGPQEVSCRRPQ